jgi:flagellar hook protein FlgE
MLESIQIGVTGLLGYQRGLRVIANNTANLNTPGFKGSTLQFADLFYANGGTGGNSVQLGYGLQTSGTRIDFHQGELRQTGNDFDLAMDGEGLFTLRDAQGQVRYTRDGQFRFDADGFLVGADGSHVQGYGADGELGDITLDGLRVSGGQATGTARFTGNLSSTTTEQTVQGMKLYDAAGEEHVISLKFTAVGATQPGAWKVEMFEGSTSLGTGQLVFEDGHPTAETGTLTFSFAPGGRTPTQLVLDFSSDVTSFASGNLSTLAMSSQDGWGPGSLSGVTFDASGTLVAHYTNGQTREGAQLALGRFTTPDAVELVGGNQFAAADGTTWLAGTAGEGGFGAVRAGMLETSNVDLSREFSDLVVMQRGYQAASQVVSTANDMLQELFGMKNR